MGRNQIIAFCQLARFDRPVGILLLLWPTLCGLWLAYAGPPPWPVLIVFVVGVVLTRSAGCVINDMADRDIDPHVQRTALRPLAAKRLSGQQAITWLAILLLMALGVALYLGVGFLVWCMPALLLMLVYPFAKRWFFCPQLLLGVAFSWSVVLAWVVAKQPLGASIIWLLFGANVCWTIGYDTLYAMADKADDQVLGVHSFAITLGDYDFLGVVLCYAACFGCWLLLLKHLMPTGWAWLPTLLAIVEAVHLLWRANDRQPRHCFQAFLVNQRLGLWLWLTLVLHFMS